jgi:short-subunit dehydrogenase
MRNLKRKRVLITGAGHGLGRELAVSFARAGAEIVVTDRNVHGVENTVGLIRETGGRASGYSMDVTDAENIAEAREQIHAELGPIDVLINNAGMVRGGTFLQVPIEEHLATYQVNALGMIAVTHAFLQDLIAAPEGHVVNIASASGLIPLPYAATYASSKWAVIGFSESILEELRLMGHTHVGVTTVCPSYIGTGMFSGVRLPKFSTVLTPERVAQLTLRAVERRKAFVMTPWFVAITPLCKVILPTRLFRWFCDWLDISTGMSHWRGHGLTDPRLELDPAPLGAGGRTPAAEPVSAADRS